MTIPHLDRTTRHDGGSETTATVIGEVTTEYGNGFEIVADPDELQHWARRWPCSVLAQVTGRMRASFDEAGDLYDVDHPGVDDIPADEFNAWVMDVRAAAGLPYR